MWELVRHLTNKDQLSLDSAFIILVVVSNNYLQGVVLSNGAFDGVSLKPRDKGGLLALTRLKTCVIAQIHKR